MELPYMNSTINKSVTTTANFGGLNQRLIVNENEFADMKNLSTRHYPAITTRKTRGEATDFQSYYIDNDTARVYDNVNKKVYTAKVDVSILAQFVEGEVGDHRIAYSEYKLGYELCYCVSVDGASGPDLIYLDKPEDCGFFFGEETGGEFPADVDPFCQKEIRFTLHFAAKHINGIKWKNGLFEVSATNCFYNGELIKGFVVDDTPKKLIGMGAYVIIFPDKMRFNTADGTWDNLEATYADAGSEYRINDSKKGELSSFGINVTGGSEATDTITYAKVNVGFETPSTVNDPIYIFKFGSSSHPYYGLYRNGSAITGTTSLPESDVPDLQEFFDENKSPEGSTAKVRFIQDGNKWYYESYDQETLLKSKVYIDDAVKFLHSISLTEDEYSFFDDDGSGVLTLTIDEPGHDPSQYTISGDVFMKAVGWKSGDYLVQKGYYAEPESETSAYSKWYIAGIGEKIKSGDAIQLATNVNGEESRSYIVREAGRNYIILPTKLDSTITGSGLKITRLVPDMDLICESNNRLWGCKFGVKDGKNINEIYASKLGDPTNWSAFEGLSTDSYRASVGTDGPWTGCIPHLDYILFFKEDSLHIMYGDKPSNFSIQAKALPGVKEGCSDSLIVINQVLYYVGRQGVYAYTGGLPQKITDNITKDIDNAKSGQYNSKLYLSCTMGDEQTILCYDPQYQIWEKEDNDIFKFVTCGDGELFYIDKDDMLTTIAGDREEEIEWFMESGDIVESSLDEKWISKLKFNFWLSKGSEATIYLKCDDANTWRKCGRIKATQNRTYTLPIVPRRCNKFRYRIEGKGEFKLLGLSREVERGSEINGHIQAKHN